MDILLIIVVIFLALVLIAVNIYLLMYYSHPDDEGFGVSIWPKILVVLGLTLAFSQVLIIPLDAANSRGSGGGLRLDILWKTILIAVAVFSLILAPFSLFYYEADEEKSFCSKFCYAFKMEFILLVILVALFTVGYIFLKEAEIPIKEITLNPGNQISSTLTLLITRTGHAINIASKDGPYTTPAIINTTMNLDVSIFIFIIALFSWFGWYFLCKGYRWLFAIYGGVGLPSLPLDLINNYCSRPKRMKESEFNKVRNNLSLELIQLKEVGEQIRLKDAEAKKATGWWNTRSKRGAVSTSIKNYEIAIKDISKRFELIKIQANYNRRAHPIFYAIKLIIGIIFILVSLVWVAHM